MGLSYAVSLLLGYHLSWCVRVIVFIALSCDSHMFIILLQTIQSILSSIRAASEVMYSEDLLIAGWLATQTVLHLYR